MPERESFEVWHRRGCPAPAVCVDGNISRSRRDERTCREVYAAEHPPESGDLLKGAYGCGRHQSSGTGECPGCKAEKSCVCGSDDGLHREFCEAIRGLSERVAALEHPEPAGGDGVCATCHNGECLGEPCPLTVDGAQIDRWAFEGLVASVCNPVPIASAEKGRRVRLEFLAYPIEEAMRKAYDLGNAAEHPEPAGGTSYTNPDASGTQGESERDRILEEVIGALIVRGYHETSDALQTVRALKGKRP